MISPGRFFAAHQLKLLLAYIVLHYELQPREKVELKYVTDFVLPPVKEKVLVRRRTDISDGCGVE